MGKKQAISGHRRGSLPFAPERAELRVAIFTDVFSVHRNVGDYITAGETIIARKAQ